MTRTRKPPEVRTMPLDGSTPADARLGYLICGFTEAGDVARPGQTYTSALWSRDRSGKCASDRHGKCAHRAGGPHADGQACTGADERKHVWQCGCDCHGLPAQTDTPTVTYIQQPQRGERIDQAQLALF